MKLMKWMNWINNYCIKTYSHSNSSISSSDRSSSSLVRSWIISLDLVDLPKLVKSVNNPIMSKNKIKNTVYYLKLCSFIFIFFLFNIIFPTYFSMDFIIFGHLIDFRFAGKNIFPSVFHVILALSCFSSLITYYKYIQAHIFSTFCISTPYWTNSLLQ